MKQQYTDSQGLYTTVGDNTGPLTVGTTTAPPISPIADGKNDLSISCVNTPGEIIISAILFFIYFVIFNIIVLDINIKKIYKPKLL